MTRGERRLEIIAAVILSITTILTAWTAFESSKWSGEQSIAFSKAGASRTESVRYTNIAAAERNLDVSLFTQWAQAVSDDNVKLRDFLQERFRDEMKPAFNAWVASKPLKNPDAPSSPFVMDQYHLAADDTAKELAQEASDYTATALRNNQRSDNYVLTTVLFAVVLFFVGIGTKFESTRVQAALLTLGFIGLVTGIIVVSTFPIKI